MNFVFSWQEQHSAALTREILFLPLEHKIHIFSPPCNILYILHADRKTCTQKMRAKLFLLSLYSRHLFIKWHYVYKIINNINCPKQLTGYLVKRSQRHCQSLRDPTLLDLPLVKTKCGQTSFKFLAVSAWNKLLRETRELRTLTQFKVRTFTYLMNMDRANHVCKSNA